jgi:hypothetical protein
MEKIGGQKWIRIKYKINVKICKYKINIKIEI